MASKPLLIDPALLAYLPGKLRQSVALLPSNPSAAAGAAPLAHIPHSTEYNPSSAKIGVGYGASTIGVGYASSSLTPYPSLADTTTPAVPAPVVTSIPIDPALFQLEEVVKSVRASAARGTISNASTVPAVLASQPTPEAVVRAGQPTHQGSSYTSGTLGPMEGSLDPAIDPSLQNASEERTEDTGTGLGEEFDPQIREIVQRLTKAQEDQLHDEHAEHVETHAEADTALTEALTDEQTVAAISAHLVAAEGMDQHIQNSLASMTSDHLNSFFPRSPSAQNYLLSDYTEAQPHSTTALQTPLGQSDLDMRISSALQAESFNHPSALASSSTTRAGLLVDSHQDGTDLLSPGGVKRKRGRPKGSKNKPKPYSSTPPPKSPKAAPARPKPEGPPKRIGRPPKERTGDELEEYLRRQAEAAAGIKRQRGRPRKFPGYLVRNMRLKANREEFREVVRRYAEEDGVAHGSSSGSQAGPDGWAEAGGSQGGSASGKDGYQAMDVDEEAEEDANDRAEVEEEEYDWANDPQNLMDAVSGHIEAGQGELGLGMKGMEGGLGVDNQNQQQREERNDDEPSADTGLGREGMGHVFGLEEA